jgi:hypothetical protein
MSVTSDPVTSDPVTSDPVDREAVFARKRAARQEGIARLIEAEAARGKKLDRLIAAITWDSECAPMTTNLDQLREIGIYPPEVDALSDDDLPSKLRLVVGGLADLGVFLTGTNHLSDRRLLTVLCNKILPEQVRDLAPSPEYSEFIDLSAVPPSDRRGRRPRTGAYRAVSDREATLPRPQRELRDMPSARHGGA